MHDVMSLQFIGVDSNWCHHRYANTDSRESGGHPAKNVLPYLQECSTTPHRLFSHSTLAREHVDFLLSHCRDRGVLPVFILPNPFVNGLTFQAVY